MKALLLPLDERPCNRVFPELIARTNANLELVEPPLDILGDKKTPANVDKLAEFVRSQAQSCDVAVVSMDMLLYGGLIPSRLHNLSREEAQERLELLRSLKHDNPKLRIYAFQCIMRAPQYDSSEEEPEYYAEYGWRLFRRKYLLDYAERTGELTPEEQKELAEIEIPQDIIDDYETRRFFNEEMNIATLDLLEEGAIDFLVIPQDDSSPYGYTALSQKRVIAEIKQRKLDDSVMIYPGADEVGLSLLTRAYVDFYHLKPRIYAFFSSTLGPSIVPRYEDRPMLESLKAHVRVVGARLCETSDKADLVLAINAPGKFMQESFLPAQKIDISYTSYRNLGDFCQRIAEYLDEGKRVALCDSAYCNGGDRQCIEMLDRMDVLDKLCSYAGWNTNCNTLGTTLAQAILGKEHLVENLCYRIIEDAFYQPEVRPYVVENILPAWGLSYYDFKDRQRSVEKYIAQALQERFDGLRLAKTHPVTIKRIYMPWKRMFEIGMELE